MAGLYINIWYGLWVPKGTPPEIKAKLNAAVVEALADPKVRQQLSELGQVIPPRDQQTPGSAGGLPESRDREVVADRQGGQHEGRVGVVCRSEALNDLNVSGRRNDFDAATLPD